MQNKSIPDQHRKRLETLAGFIREYRINEGMTRNDLHQNLNLHVNSIVRAENAKNISLLTLFEIVDTLDLNLKDLFWDIE